LRSLRPPTLYIFFFSTNTATTEIYTLSLHDALPILRGLADACRHFNAPVTGGNCSLYNQSPNGPIDPTPTVAVVGLIEKPEHITDRKSTRLNSSHDQISYAVFCLKKKKKKKKTQHQK